MKRFMTTCLVIVLCAIITVPAKAAFVPTQEDEVFELPAWAQEQFGNDLLFKMFEPSSNTITRAQYTLFLYYTAVSSNPNFKVSENYEILKQFDDFDDKMSEEEKIALATLVDSGILKGSQQGDKLLLNTEGKITRAEAATLLERFAKKKLFDFASGDDKQTTFIDVPETHWAYQSVNWAYAHGLFNGTGNGRFSPTAEITIVETLKLGFNLTKTDTDVTVLQFCVSACKVFKVSTKYASSEITPNAISLEIKAKETGEISFYINSGETFHFYSSDLNVATVSKVEEKAGYYVVTVYGVKQGSCYILATTGNNLTSVSVSIEVAANESSSGSSGGGSSGGGNTPDPTPTPTPNPPGKDDVNNPGGSENPGTPGQPTPPAPDDSENPDSDNPITPPVQPGNPGGDNNPGPDDDIGIPEQPGNGGSTNPTPDDDIGVPEQPGGNIPTPDDDIGIPNQPGGNVPTPPGKGDSQNPQP